ncbi:DMT family transporter (plasmid) [Rhizobium johnstonii]|nr:DMT family transporter [Rhizobium johnstonii]
MSVVTDPKPGRPSAGFATLVASATFLMGSTLVASKILLSNGIPVMLLLGWRFVIAAATTLPFLLYEAGDPQGVLFPRHMRWKAWAAVALVGLLQTTAVTLLLAVAVRTISPVAAAILLVTNPLWSTLLGHVISGDALNRPKIIAFVSASAGIAVALGGAAYSDDPGGAVTGSLVGLASALCLAVATVIGRLIVIPLSPTALNFWQMLAGSVPVLCAAYLIGERWPGLAWHIWVWFFWMAIPATLGAYYLWHAAVGRAGSSQRIRYLFLAPISTVLLSQFSFGLTIAPLEVAEGVLIGAALWFVNRR